MSTIRLYDIDSETPEFLMEREFPTMSTNYAFAYERWFDFLNERASTPVIPDGFYIDASHNGQQPSWYVTTEPRIIF